VGIRSYILPTIFALLFHIAIALLLIPHWIGEWEDPRQTPRHIQATMVDLDSLAQVKANEQQIAEQKREAAQKQAEQERLAAEQEAKEHAAEEAKEQEEARQQEAKRVKEQAEQAQKEKQQAEEKAKQEAKALADKKNSSNHTRATQNCINIQ
jgi:colicin import membrane protein